ncbi:MAG: CD1871A family CXXC motif-containing protein [Thermodesulfobacteriota bacterium]
MNHPPEGCPAGRPAVRPGISLGLVGFFVLLWMLGVAAGEPRRVLEQAVQLCLSCIGIG